MRAKQCVLIKTSHAEVRHEPKSDFRKTIIRNEVISIEQNQKKLDENEL